MFICIDGQYAVFKQYVAIMQSSGVVVWAHNSVQGTPVKFILMISASTNYACYSWTLKLVHAWIDNFLLNFASRSFWKTSLDKIQPLHSED